MTSIDVGSSGPGELFTELVSAAQTGIIVWELHDPDDPGAMVLVYANRSAAAATGRALEDAVGQTMRELFPEPVDAARLAAYAEVALGGPARIMPDVSYQETSGARIFSARLFALSGRRVGVELNEVTAERAAEARRVDTLAQQLAAIVNCTDDAVLSTSADGRVLSWNPGAERIFGYSADEAIGRDVTFLACPGDEDEIAATMARLASGEHIGQLQTVRRHRDGRPIDVALTLSALTGADGVMIGGCAIARDITGHLHAQAERERLVAAAERERAAVRLERAQRLESLGQLAGGIAHDFNNLLGIVIGYSGVIGRRLGAMQDGTGDPELGKLSADVAQISEAGRRAAALTHQLLAFARQDTVEPDVIDVNTTITEMLGLLTRTLGPHIELSANLDPDLFRTRIDPGQLGQILVNLAVNSREAMPDGGRLAIETTRTRFAHDQALSHGVLPAGPYVRIRVNDNGTGMPADVVEHAFDPFFTTRAAGSGTGLGLATVYGIIAQAGGQVEIYSESGQGTTVAILLPATDAPLTSLPTPGDLPSPALTAARTILIVDDEPALQAVTAQVIANAGYHVISARAGAEAIAAAQSTRHPIDLLLTDVVMPGMAGQELAAQLKAARPEIRIIFMSGFARPFLPDHGRSISGRLLQKPFTEAELLTAIAHTLAAPPDGDDRPRAR